MLGGENFDHVFGRQNLAGQRVNFHDPLDFVAPHLDAKGGFGIGRKDLQRIAAHPKRATMKINIVALELQVNQRSQHFVAIANLADAQRQCHLTVIRRRTQTVDRRHRRNNQHILAGKQSLRRFVAQTVNFLVDLGFFFDI